MLGARAAFDLARISKAPIAIEAVERIDALFAIEREINGASPHERKRVRSDRSRPLIATRSPRRSNTASIAGPSASNCIALGTLIPSAVAVPRLMTSSNFVAWSTGRSPGFSRFRIRGEK